MSAFDVSTHHRVRLLDLDPGFEAAIPEEHQDAARRLITAQAQQIAPGPFTPDLTCQDGRRGFALFVLSGLLLREVVMGGRRAAQVYGPGDVLRPAAAEDSSLSEAVEWTVISGGSVAVLDHVFVAAGRKWPAFHAVVDDRLFAQIERAAVQLAIAQLPRIEERLLAMLWHLGDRFGQVTPDGVAVPFPLTHETLGRLVGARRPTVTLGLATLQETGSLSRRPRGGWLLHVRSRSLLSRPADDIRPPRVGRPPLRVLAQTAG